MDMIRCTLCLKVHDVHVYVDTAAAPHNELMACFGKHLKTASSQQASYEANTHAC